MLKYIIKGQENLFVNTIFDKFFFYILDNLSIFRLKSLKNSNTLVTKTWKKYIHANIYLKLY